MCPRWEQGVRSGGLRRPWGPWVCIPSACPGGAQSPGALLRSAFVSQCQGPPALHSTGLCLLANATVVLECVPFKRRVSVTACFPSEAEPLCL